MTVIPNLPVTHLLPFAEIEESRQVLLVTSPPAWLAVRHHLSQLKTISRLEPKEATLAGWEAALASVLPARFECIYSVGGGLTVDAGKYFAAQLGLPLVVLPTALSVDAFLTAASGIRRDGCVHYLPTVVPDRLILDLDVIAAAPAGLRAAGVTDVLSIATGCWDWKYAHERGENPPGMEYIPWVYENAQTILHAVLDCAGAAGAGDKQGLKTLFDCLAMEVQLCNQVGHARPEEGSEHYFAYCAEQFTGAGWPHGDLVGPGILHMLRKQGQDSQPVKNALQACDIPLDRIPAEGIQQTMLALPGYCRKHKLPFGIAHTLEETR